MPSLVLIKPDAFQHRLVGWIIANFERFGFNDVQLRQMDEELCRAHYLPHVDKPFYPDLQKFMLSGPVIAIDVDRGWSPVRDTATRIRQHWKGYVDGPRNLIHSSDSYSEAQRELDVWFPSRPIRWNPFNRVVQDHRNGSVYLDETDAVRAAKGLPTPWTPEMASLEISHKPVF